MFIFKYIAESGCCSSLKRRTGQDECDRLVTFRPARHPTDNKCRCPSHFGHGLDKEITVHRPTSQKEDRVRTERCGVHEASPAGGARTQLLAHEQVTEGTTETPETGDPIVGTTSAVNEPRHRGRRGGRIAARGGDGGGGSRRASRCDSTTAVIEVDRFLREMHPIVHEESATVL